jgi:hypothetical protein
VFIPRNSSLWASSVLTTDTGALLEFHHPTLGRWRGITQPPTFRENGSGADVQALQLAAFAGVRLVATNRTLRGVSAGVAAAYGFRDAVAGLGGATWHLNTIYDGPPILPSVRFTGQTLSTFLSDLAAQSGQEWTVSDDFGFTWGPPPGAQAPLYLQEGGDILDLTTQADTSQRVSQVVATGSNGTGFVVDDPIQIGAFWARQTSLAVNSSQPSAVAIAARGALAQSSQVAVQYSGALRPHQWASVREGDLVRLGFPHAAFSGQCPVARVISRSWTEPATTITLSLMKVRDWSELGTVPAGYALLPERLSRPPPQASSEPASLFIVAQEQVGQLRRLAGL